MATEAFHAGEQALQREVGVRDRMAAVGPAVLRDHLPDQHRELFGKLPYLVLGSVDADGRPWASMVAGAPGFVTSPDPHTLVVAARLAPGDPVETNARVGAPLAVLGIELHTRRRNRANGRVRARIGDTVTLGVEQSFGNCPKYLQARRATPIPPGPPREAVPEGPRLSDAAVAVIRAADTCFLATHAGGGARNLGADVSHRGGKPGFVRVDRAGEGAVLTLPDFAGNQFFNTLGNLLLDPRIGVAFVDFPTGDVWTFTGRAEIAVGGPELASFAGALRLVRVRLEGGLRLPGAVALAWSPPELAPQLTATGSWG